MDNNVLNGYRSLTTTVILSIVSWLGKFSYDDIDILIRVVTATATIVAAIFTARYHYIAAKNEKKSEKQD